MWFWLRRLIKSVTVKPTLANSVAPGQPFGTVEVQLLEPAPIGGVKVEFGNVLPESVKLRLDSFTVSTGKTDGSANMFNAGTVSITRGTAVYPNKLTAFVGDDELEVAVP